MRVLSRHAPPPQKTQKPTPPVFPCLMSTPSGFLGAKKSHAVADAKRSTVFAAATLTHQDTGITTEAKSPREELFLSSHNNSRFHT